MDLLYANDRAGSYPDSWYAATATPLEAFAPLKGQQTADVVVIGGGFTGLSAALHLAEAGFNVALLEAHRVGFGASGRNGGQLGSGQRMEQHGIEKLMGAEDATKLWELAEEAKDLVKHLISKHSIDCYLKPGVAHTAFSKSEMQELHDEADHLTERYGYTQIEKLDAEQMHAICPSPRYHGGTLDMGAAHLHPLRYALGLASAAAKAGVRIYERSRVHDITPGTKTQVRTDHGAIKADHVILGCNGYLGGLNRKVAARVMPIKISSPRQSLWATPPCAFWLATWLWRIRNSW